ncbi:MAG: hypothetical protein ACE5GA_08970, partial [Candidatus Zixiibacteriota bacterium]
MKRFTTLVVCGLVFTLAVTGAAKKPRKLPMKAYITGAKISGGFTGETPNSDAALALLDTCLMFYGMVPEAYFWQVSILSELAEEIPSNDTAKLIEGLTRFKTTYDSLVLSCDEEFKEVKIKKKLRKKCSDFRATADSLHHERYAEYFNRAQESRNLVLDTLVKELEELTNEEDIADMKEEIKVAIAEAIANYDIASILKPDDASIAIHMGDIYSSQRQYDKALKYQRHAAEITKERDPGNYPAMLNQVAYSYYELKEFEKSADVFKEIAELVEGEQRIMQYRNVVACYSSVSQADSVFVYNYKVLEI